MAFVELSGWPARVCWVLFKVSVCAAASPAAASISAVADAKPVSAIKNLFLMTFSFRARHPGSTRDCREGGGYLRRKRTKKTARTTRTKLVLAVPWVFIASNQVRPNGSGDSSPGPQADALGSR